MFITFKDARIVPDPRAVNQDGKPYAKVLYLGGTVNVLNPKKLSGDFKTVEISADIGTEAKAWVKEGESQAKSWVGFTVRFGEILAANK